MRVSNILFKSGQNRRHIQSLALSVHFKQPDFGMNEYEILSRASGFLLAVDPPDLDSSDGPYGHLEKNERERRLKLHKQDHKYSPAGGPSNRELKDLGWLEFAPQEVRPTVHFVCSSHVLAPFLWKDYYPQEWLSKVNQEHCAYSIEVYDTESPEESLGKFALNPYPIHHPEGRDIAFIHLQQEEENLKIMKQLGVKIHNMRDLDSIYNKGDEVAFDGCVVAEQNKADYDDIAHSVGGNADSTSEDTRVFFPYQVSGFLNLHARDRFFAKTEKPLPEGLCGGPVLDEDGLVCGVIEGIVEKNHANKDIAGSAAFMPNYMISPFIEYAERFMLKRILPKSLFQKAVTAKTTNSLGGGMAQGNQPNESQHGSTTAWEEAFDRAVDQLKKNHTKEEVDAILNTIQEERNQVLDILDKEGGDLEEVAARVRRKTMEIREMIHEEYRRGQHVEGTRSQ